MYHLQSIAAILIVSISMVAQSSRPDEITISLEVGTRHHGELVEPDIPGDRVPLDGTSGGPQYRLGSHLITGGLLSEEDFRSIIRSHSGIGIGPGTTSQIHSIQTVSYQQDVVGANEPAEVANKSEWTPPPVANPESNTAAASPAAVDSEDAVMQPIRNEIDAHQKAFEADTQISDVMKSSRLQILASANEALLRINELDGKRLTINKQIQELQNDEQRTRELLAQVVEPAEPVIDDRTRSETIDRELSERRNLLEQKKAALLELEKEIRHHSERVAQIPIDRAKANEKLKTILGEIAKFQSDDTDSQLGLLLQKTKQRAVEAELKKLDAEVERQELGAKIDPIKRDLVSRDVHRLQKEIKRWEKAAKNLRQSEVEAEQRLASDAAETAHWSLKPLAQRNAALIEEQNAVVEKLQSLKMELGQITNETESIVHRRTEIELKIQAAGLTGTNGMLLVELRPNLMTTGECHIRIRQLQKELSTVNLAKVSLKEERDQLADPQATVKQLIQSEETTSPLARKAIQFVETKRDYLDQLMDDYQTYGRMVSVVSEERKKLVDEINRTQAWIDVNALWVRSSDPVALSNLSLAGKGLSDFFNAPRWSELAGTTVRRIGNRLYESILALCFMFVLLAVNRRVKQKLQPRDETDESSA